jgi:prepilin peptidase CpaA
MIFQNTNIILITLLIVAVINDIRYQKIPNLLTFPAMIMGIGYHIVMNGFDGFIFSIEGLIIGIGLLIVFHLMGGMGAGDVKFMGAIGAFLGPKAVLTVFIYAALIGGIYAVAVLAYHGLLKAAVKRHWTILKTYLLSGKFIYVPDTQEERKLKLYYGVPIALGALSATLGSVILTLI